MESLPVRVDNSANKFYQEPSHTDFTWNRPKQILPGTDSMDPDKPIKAEEWTEEISAEREKEERALVRRIDILLMPMLWVMYVFSYADRTK